MNDFNYIDHYQKDAFEFDYFEERKGATAHDERRVREYIISKVKKNTKSILDVGCGRAWVAKHFTHKNINVCSFDISLTNPSRAIKLYPSEYHKGVVGDSFHLPFEDESFDCVIASEIIEHVFDPVEFIKELFRIVKKDCQLILTTPYKEKIQYYLCIHCNKKTPAHAHIHSFDEIILSNLYTENNLAEFKYNLFGDKVLIYLRTHVILQYLPFWLWRIKDWFFVKMFKKPAHIICVYRKADR